MFSFVQGSGEGEEAVGRCFPPGAETFGFSPLDGRREEEEMGCGVGICMAPFRTIPPEQQFGLRDPETGSDGDACFRRWEDTLDEV